MSAPCSYRPGIWLLMHANPGPTCRASDVCPAACFENTVQALYKYVVPKPKVECSKNEQLGVSFAAGYIAGVFCAIVSHPADNLVSKLNSNKSATISSVVNEMGW